VRDCCVELFSIPSQLLVVEVLRRPLEFTQDAPVLVTALHPQVVDPLPAQEPREVLLRLFLVGVSGQRGDVLAHHLVRSVSVQTLRARVPARDLPVGPDRVDSVVGALNHRGQVLGTWNRDRFTRDPSYARHCAGGASAAPPSRAGVTRSFMVPPR